VALTFDDGPSPQTPELLDVLAGHGIRATFFVCGTHVGRLPHIARRIIADGHEIGNHTDTHPALWMRSRSFMRQEIGRAQQAIQDATGSAPSLFRAPYGVRWFGLGDVLDEYGLTGVMWTVIGRDWVLPSQNVARRVISGVRNGAIVCLHDGRELDPAPDISNTIEAVRQIVPSLHTAGYAFRTVSDLFRISERRSLML
jgi:peptidoglycan/xylan/chitin deacetylase (PgdA/CDA1 family)